MINFSGKTTDALIDEMKSLDAKKSLAKDRMKVARSDAGKVMIEDLKYEIERIRSLYITINHSRHTNIIASELAVLQGREHALTAQLKKWTDAKNDYEKVDKELKICQKEIVTRNEETKNRSI